MLMLQVLPISLCALASRTVLSRPNFLCPFGPLALAIVFLKRSRSATFFARSLSASSLALCRASISSLFFVLLRSLSERAVGVVAAAVSRSSAWVLARVTSLLALRRDQDAAPEWALVQAR